MSLKINTNIAALNAHRSMLKNDNALSTSLERLSTGLRINRSGDDASGMAIANALKAQSLGIGQAVKNINDGISIVQTAEGALQESINIINTIKTKSIQAASDGQTKLTRRIIQNDIDKLMEELESIAKNTNFNGQKLLSGVFVDKKIQIGPTANETAKVSIESAEPSRVGHISQGNLNILNEQGGEIQLNIRSSITGKTLTLSSINIENNNKQENGLGTLADEINKYTSTTGISGRAIVTTTSKSAITAGTTGENFEVNGIPIGAVPVENNDSNNALISSINSQTSLTGVEAYLESDGKITLSSTDGRGIKVSGSISEIFGSTAQEMSTLGHIALTQKGVSEFQISGMETGTIGGQIKISDDLILSEDSMLAAGSTIAAGSRLAANTVVGGDVWVEASIKETEFDYSLKAGSSLGAFTEIGKDTVLGGAIIVAGDTNQGVDAPTSLTALEQDMLITEGTILKKGTVIGKDTNWIYNGFNGVLENSFTLDEDITIEGNSTLLKYNNDSIQNTHIRAGSTISRGSELGAKIEIGATYNSSVAAIAVDSNKSIFLNTNSTTATEIKAGSLIKDGSTLELVASSSWAGPTLITTNGTIEKGDNVVGSKITLQGNQVLSQDLTSTLFTTGANSELEAGTILVKGSTDSGATGYEITIDSANISQNMILEKRSNLATGSKLLSGSILGNDTYVMGGKLDETSITTIAITDLKAGTIFKPDSVIGEGSVINGGVKVKENTIINSDMALGHNTFLANGTKIKAGTIIEQDIILSPTDATSDADTSNVKAGTTLASDMFISYYKKNLNGVTLTASMNLVEGSIIGKDSEVFVNTGSISLDETTTYTLKDVNVLDQEGAQRAISIAESALVQIDEIKSSLGSVQNKLSVTIANLSVTKTNIQASESVIRDVDFAEEVMIFSKMQMLGQSSSFALAQANASVQNVMSLLQ